MSNINQVTISGNLTANAEVRQTKSGRDAVNFSVAVNEQHVNKQTNQWESTPNFIDCVYFAPANSKIGAYLKKGQKVCVSGKLHQSRWQDANGNNRSKIEVLASAIDIMFEKQQQREQQPSAQPEFDERIPF